MNLFNFLMPSTLPLVIRFDEIACTDAKYRTRTTDVCVGCIRVSVCGPLPPNRDYAMNI